MITANVRVRRRAGFALAVGVAVALVASTGGVASAAETGTWAAFSVAGSARAYTGTLSLPGGFPSTTFTSTSRQATVVSGASTWQAASTPVGAVYGSSRNQQYLNQRPAADNATSPAVTTYSFATPTPASGWSFVLGDIDADQATISATAADGSTVPISDLGFQGVYNYCHRAGGPSCDSANLNDLPTWNPATGVLLGNPTASDTEGASGWFNPSVPLKTLTITYQWRSGFPVYQTWFATKTFAASGAVTVNGKPYGAAKLSITDASGAVVATTETGGDGTWSVPGLVSTSGYTVSVDTPPGADAAAPLTFDTLDADTPGLDFAFTIAPVTIDATVTTATGEPAANQPVVVTRTGDDAPTATTTTDATGAFTADLLPQQEYKAVVGGETITFTSPTTSGSLALAPAPVVTPTPTPTPTPVPTSTATPVVAAAPSAPELAMTGSNPALPLGIGILVALAGAVLVARSRRATRRR
jgi:hypothetical protein